MKKVIVDCRISEEEKNSLFSLGYQWILCPPYHGLHESVRSHPDLQLHFIDDTTLVVHKNIDPFFLKELLLENLKVFYSKNSLQLLYPQNITLNALNIKNHFIHFIKHTDKTLLEQMKTKKIINVKQGYTKCSAAIVSDHAIVTSDPSICRALSLENVDVLYVPPGDILLPGLDYGFIGGTCGLLDGKTLAFYGDLNYYAYGKEVMSFLKKHDVTPIFLYKGKLIDRGTLFSINKNL